MAKDKKKKKGKEAAPVEEANPMDGMEDSQDMDAEGGAGQGDDALDDAAAFLDEEPAAEEEVAAPEVAEPAPEKAPEKKKKDGKDKKGSKGKKDKKGKKEKKPKAAEPSGGEFDMPEDDDDGEEEEVAEEVPVPAEKEKKSDRLPGSKAKAKAGKDDKAKKKADKKSKKAGPEEVAAPPVDFASTRTETMPFAASAVERALAAAAAAEAQTESIKDKYGFIAGDLDYNVAIINGEQAVQKIDPTGGRALKAADLKGRSLENLNNMLADFSGKDQIMIKKRIELLQSTDKRIAGAIKGFRKLVSDTTLGEALKQMEAMEAEVKLLKKGKGDDEKLKEITAIVEGCQPVLKEIVIFRGKLYKGGGKDGKKTPKERLFVLVKDLPKPGSRTLRYYDAKKYGKELGQIDCTADGKVTKTDFDAKAKRHCFELVAVDKKNGARTFFFSTAKEELRDDFYYELKGIVGESMTKVGLEAPEATVDDDGNIVGEPVVAEPEPAEEDDEDLE